MTIWQFFVSYKLLIFNMKPCNLYLNDLVPSADGNKCHTFIGKIYKTVYICKIPEVSMIMRSK